MIIFCTRSWKRHTEREDTDSEECDQFDNDYEIEIPIYHKKKLAEASGESSTTEDKKPRLLETMLSSSDVASTLDQLICRTGNLCC